jgi:hypothetical protein
MRRFLPLLAIACAAILAGCSREPEVVPVGSLAFPVVLITGTNPSNALPHRAKVIADASELGRMRVEQYSTLTDTTISDPPIVIDSAASIFDMKDIEGEHGGLWMMANPTGMMPIRYKLVRREPSGIEPARTLIANCKYLGGDLDQDRRELRSERIRRAGSMAEIMQIVDEAREAEGSQGDGESQTET